MNGGHLQDRAALRDGGAQKTEIRKWLVVEQGECLWPETRILLLQNKETSQVLI